MIGRGETIRFAVLCELCFCLSTVNALEKMRGHETQTSSCYIFLRNQAPFRDKPLIVANTDSLFYPDCCLWPVDRLVQVISFPTFDKPALAAICLFATRGHWLPFKRTKKGERGQEISLHMFNHKIHVQHISEFVCVLWMRFYLKQPQWTCSPKSLEEFSVRIIIWFCLLFESVLISQSLLFLPP